MKNYQSSIELLELDVSNQIKHLTSLKFENIVLKSKESTFIKVIEEAKKNEGDFNERFRGAHDFL